MRDFQSWIDHLMVPRWKWPECARKRMKRPWCKENGSPVKSGLAKVVLKQGERKAGGWQWNSLGHAAVVVGSENSGGWT